jgi:hypothetical protein
MAQPFALTEASSAAFSNSEAFRRLTGKTSTDFSESHGLRALCAVTRTAHQALVALSNVLPLLPGSLYGPDNEIECCNLSSSGIVQGQ